MDLCGSASSGRRGRPQFCFTPPWKFRRERSARAAQLVKRAHLARRAASFLLSCRHICDVARSWHQHGGRVHRPRQGRQAQRRRRLRVHGRLAVPGRLEAGPQERPRHALVCQRCAAPPPQFRRHRRRRLTSPCAARRRPIRGRVGEWVDARARRVHLENWRQVHRRGELRADPRLRHVHVAHQLQVRRRRRPGRAARAAPAPSRSPSARRAAAGTSGSGRTGRCTGTG